MSGKITDPMFRRWCAAAFGAFLLLAVANEAMAESRGWYVGASSGITFDLWTEDFAIEDDIDGEIDFKVGWSVVGAAIGYAFANGARVELSPGFSSLSVGSVSTSVGDVGSGDVRTIEVMINGYYDFDVGRRWRPYVGAGVGGVRTRYDNVTFLLSDTQLLDDKDISAAGQAILGVAYAPSRSWDVFAEYRLFGTFSRQEFGFDDGGVGRSRFVAHRMLFGLRWFFQAPGGE